MPSPHAKSEVTRDADLYPCAIAAVSDMLKIASLPPALPPGAEQMRGAA